MFLAIVHAPKLRAGARLCISGLDQTCERAPARLAPGAGLSLRFGTCCPDLSQGTVVVCDTRLNEAVLKVADATWTIRRSSEHGIDLPGLVAENWIVAAA